MKTTYLIGGGPYNLTGSQSQRKMNIKDDLTGRLLLEDDLNKYNNKNTSKKTI